MDWIENDRAIAVVALALSVPFGALVIFLDGELALELRGAVAVLVPFGLRSLVLDRKVRKLSADACENMHKGEEE